MNRFSRIFILGAGFSQPANLPLGRDLWERVWSRADAVPEVKASLAKDLTNFLEYKRCCDDVEIPASEVDFEEFLSYLDIEHYLGLSGTSWGPEGNQSQSLIKRLIGKIIHEQTPSCSSVPDLYLKFASRLKAGDLVLTFNYDVLLERALERVEKAYRLFQNRYSQVGDLSNVLDRSKDEVVLLKLHGSVDWFDRGSYDQRVAISEELGNVKPHDAVFKYPQLYGAEPIVDGPRDANDPLRSMYRIRHLEDFYAHDFPPETPWILSPSYSKVLYASSLGEFWGGLGYAGLMNIGVGIIGYSMPPHDEYVKQAIFKIVRNYQEGDWEDKLLKKSKLALVDRRSEADTEELRKRYSFINWSRADLHLNGFDMDSLEILFKDDR